MKLGASPILSVLPHLPWWERDRERGPSVAGASAGMTVNRSRGRFQIAEPDRLGRVPVHVIGRVVAFPEGAFLSLASEDGNRFTLSAQRVRSLGLNYIGVAPVRATVQSPGRIAA